jgi:hypothetical protein
MTYLQAAFDCFISLLSLALCLLNLKRSTFNRFALFDSVLFIFDLILQHKPLSLLMHSMIEVFQIGKPHHFLLKRMVLQLQRLLLILSQHRSPMVIAASLNILIYETITKPFLVGRL